MIAVRNLVLGEHLPEALRTGYECGQCDPRWIWLAIHKGEPCALLVTAPAHVAVILMRLVSTEDAPKSALNSLLRQSFGEMLARGYMGYIVTLNPTELPCMELLRIIRSVGGQQRPEPNVLCYGRLDLLPAPVERIN